MSSDSVKFTTRDMEILSAAMRSLKDPKALQVLITQSSTLPRDLLHRLARQFGHATMPHIVTALLCVHRSDNMLRLTLRSLLRLPGSRPALQQMHRSLSSKKSSLQSTMALQRRALPPKQLSRRRTRISLMRRRL